jgi:hypothetical protein
VKQNVMTRLEKLTALKAFMVFTALFSPPFILSVSVSCPFALVPLPCTAVLCTITLHSVTKCRLKSRVSAKTARKILRFWFILLQIDLRPQNFSPSM